MLCSRSSFLAAVMAVLVVAADVHGFTVVHPVRLMNKKETFSLSKNSCWGAASRFPVAPVGAQDVVVLAVVLLVAPRRNAFCVSPQ